MTISAMVSIDGAAAVASTNAPTADPSAGGAYLINLAAADLNGTCVRLRFSAAGAA